MAFSIEGYIRFLDAVIAECGPAPCLNPASNAVTRRACMTYQAEARSLKDFAARHGITEVDYKTYDDLWPKLCKSEKFGILREDYAKPKTEAHDMRFPQDGRVVPGYAKDALAQLRTLVRCAVDAHERK